MPRMPETHAEEHVGQDAPTDISVEAETPKPRRSKARASEVIDTAPANVAKVAFMNEIVTVVVHESPDDNVEPIPGVSVNGRNQFFYRGVEAKVKRKFVAALARAKHTNYSQQVRIDQANGNVIQRMNPRTGLKYPFSVTHDPNPMGAAWLKSVLGAP